MVVVYSIRFDIKIIHSAHTVYLYVLWISETTVFPDTTDMFS